jgi:hypothetical protein
MGASNHTVQLQLIRYLAEQPGFLTAGDRDLVVFGVSFHLGLVNEHETGFFASMLRRHGLYMITPETGIAPAPMSGVERWLRIEKARCAGLIWNLGRLANNWAAALGGLSRRPPHDEAKYRHHWRKIMGPQWQQNMDGEVERLRETIKLLRSHHTQVKVMLLPQGTWMDELPFKPGYEAKIRALCQATTTPLIDLSRAIPDEDFVDSNHLTVQGQEKFRGLIMGQILEHLRKIKVEIAAR